MREDAPNVPGGGGSRRFVDLHAHSNRSDGTLAPAELVGLADAEGLAAVALTDHDTAAGLAEARTAAADRPELCFVPGIEISAEYPPGTLHILGLGIDENAPALRAITDRLLAARAERNPKMVAKLQAMGVDVDMDDVRAELTAGGDAPEIVTRLHIAEAVRRKGYARSAQDAFERYVGKGAPAYVDKERVPPGEAIAALRDAGGEAVLAHAVQLRCATGDELAAMVRRLADAGLTGIEAYHSDHSPEQTRRCLGLAAELGLYVTGGSDFHGGGKPHVRLGRPRVPIAALDPELLGAWCRRGR